MLDRPETSMEEKLYRIFKLDGRTRKTLWRTRGTEIVRRWTSAHPGTRPGGWWRNVAPTERLRGESQAGYLDRHNLWLPGEKARAPATAWEPGC